LPKDVFILMFELVTVHAKGNFVDVIGLKNLEMGRLF
jgi:hypothetical protein